MNSSPAHHVLVSRTGKRLVLAGLLAVALAGARSVASPVATAPEAEAALRSFVASWENADLDAAAGAFTADAVAYDAMPPGVFDTPEKIKGWIADTFKQVHEIKIPLSGLKVSTSGAVAWLTCHFTFKGVADGKPVADEGNVTMVWVKQRNGSYKLASFHASAPPPPAPPAPAK